MNSHIWNIPWQEFEVILGLKHSYSLRNLNINSPNRCESFLKSCGFDINNNNDIKQFEQLLGEALFFVRHILLTKDEREKITVPNEIIHLVSPVALLMMASSTFPQTRYQRIWACALLKVMYAIANIQFSGKIHILHEAREQIFKKIKSLIVDEKKHILSFKNITLKLHLIEWKEAKTRASIVMKLLHKPDSIVDEVFDYLGVRFVAQNAQDLPHLLRLLIDADILIPHQIVSMRTRNSLLNIKQPRKILNFLTELYSVGTLSEEQYFSMCSQVNWQQSIHDDSHKKINVFTSEHYRSLQFTVRHLVRSSNPAHAVLESLSTQLKRYTGIVRQEPWVGTVIPEQFTNYFPIEIQAMDLESYELAKFGRASHEQYKSNQLKAVRERVLNNLLNFNQEQYQQHTN